MHFWFNTLMSTINMHNNTILLKIMRFMIGIPIINFNIDYNFHHFLSINKKIKVYVFLFCNNYFCRETVNNNVYIYGTAQSNISYYILQIYKSSI